MKREKSLGAKVAGVTVAEDKPEIASGTNLRETVVEYLEEVAVHKSKKTFASSLGLANRKLQYATWRDVDLDAKTFTVREKLDFGFTTKA